MLSAPQIILGFLLPAVLVGLVLLACRVFPAGAPALIVRSLLSPAVIFGFSLAFFEFEPKLSQSIGGNVIDWLLYIPLLMGFLGLLDGLLHPPLWLRAIVLLLLWHVVARLILLPQIPSYLTESAASIWIDAASFVALMWFLGFESLAVRVTGFAVPAVLAILSAGAAILLGMTWHIQSSGQLAGALAIICFGALVASRFVRNIHLSGFAGTIALLLQLLIFHGYFYTNDTLTTAQQTWTGLYLASPALIFFADLPPIQRLRPSWRLVIRIAPLAMLIAIFAGIAVRDYLKPDQRQQSQHGY
jgi:hypothetical protein